MLGGIIIGACSMLVTLARAGGSAPTGEALRLMTRRERCDITLLLIAVDPDDTVSRTIDAATGSGGYSHVALDACRADESGRPVIIDYRPGMGVHWAPGDSYRERGVARVLLDGELGAEVFGCVASKLGEPFRVAPLVGCVDNIASCSGLVAHCLPPKMQRELRAGREGHCISPNDLARHFGARVGATVSAQERKREAWRRYSG